MSQVSSSVNDIKFNNITQSSSSSNDLHSSSFSKDKLEQSRSHGPAHFVDTHTYLSQIEQKYQEQDNKKKQQNRTKYQKFQYSTGSSQYVMRQGDGASHLTNDNQCVIPEKFRNKTSQVQPPQQFQVTVQPPPQQSPNQLAQTGAFNQSMDQGVPVMEMNIPDNLSLSRGVSERNYQPPPAQEDNKTELEQKTAFFNLVSNLKQLLPANHPGKNVLVAQIYQEMKQQQIHKQQWEGWIKQRLNRG